MKPACFDRPAYKGLWVRTGRFSKGKPVLQWIRHRMSQKCAAWDSGPSPIEESVPALKRWDCRHCRHLPNKAAMYMALNPPS